MVTVHPAPLGEALFNALECSKPKGKEHQPVDGVLLEATADCLRVYGVGRHLAGVHEVPLISANNAEASVCVERGAAERLRSTLAKQSKAKGAAVLVGIHEEPRQVTFDGVTGYANLVVTNGENVLGAAVEYDTDGRFDGAWQLVDTLLGAEPDPTLPPNIALGVETMNRLRSLKSDSLVVDLGSTTLDGRVLRFKAGTGFTGVVGLVGRLGYSKGGPSKDGPGDPEQLF